MSTQVKYEDDDLELYGDIDHEDGTGELLDPDFQKDATDERDEGAVANALGDEDESMTGTGAATAATQAQGQGQGQGQGQAQAQAQQQQQPAPIPTFQSNNNQFQNQNQIQPQGYQQGQQGVGGGAPYARAYNGDDGRGRGGGSTSDGNEEGKMFIGGLNWETDDNSLQGYFSQFGRVASSSIMRDPSGRSRGFAFLTFEDPASVNAVMAKEHVLDGKIIDPKRAIPRAEHIKSQKIFVGGLAPTVTNASLKAFFTDYGTVMDAHVMFDRETNRNKGFGFVTFEDDEGVERAMGATGQELDGKPIEVKKAQPKHQREQGDTNRRHIGSYMGEGAQSGKYNHNMNAGGAMGQNPMMSGMGMSGMGMPGMMGAGGFDPQAMAMMYQRMMMNMMGGMNGMNPMMNMGMMNQGQAGAMGGMGGASPGQTAGAMPNMMGMNMPGGAYNPMMMMNRMTSPNAALPGATPPQNPSATPANAPRGPAAMRPAGLPSAPSGGGQPARYSTQGQARSKPY